MPRKPQYDRDDLIDRARDLFWERGWAGTSLKDLEACLEMKPGSFYAAFGSKDALFALTMKKYTADGVERLEALVSAHGPVETLQRYPFLVIDNSAAPAKACMLSKTLLELQAHSHPLADEANGHLVTMSALFERLFTQAQNEGLIDRSHNTEALARRYQSDLMGLRVSAERPGFDAKAIAAEMADAVSAL